MARKSKLPDVARITYRRSFRYQATNGVVVLYEVELQRVLDRENFNVKHDGDWKAIIYARQRELLDDGEQRLNGLAKRILANSDRLRVCDLQFQQGGIVESSDPELIR